MSDRVHEEKKKNAYVVAYDVSANSLKVCFPKCYALRPKYSTSLFLMQVKMIWCLWQMLIASEYLQYCYPRTAMCDSNSEEKLVWLCILMLVLWNGDSDEWSKLNSMALAEEYDNKILKHNTENF